MVPAISKIFGFFGFFDYEPKPKIFGLFGFFDYGAKSKNLRFFWFFSLASRGLAKPKKTKKTKKTKMFGISRGIGSFAGSWLASQP